jgi:NAD(P)H-dependent flavin oxidoreductase YrpB (nitropropane dioxygenase family)
MGIAISGWPLARRVASFGQLGVVSGTALDSVFVRRLQDAGVDEELRRVLDRFPVPAVVEDVLGRFARTLRAPTAPYLSARMLTNLSPLASQDLLVLSSFVEVALAKEGHAGEVGINLLTKVQLPTVASLYGAMLADVDYVLMGAGVPFHIPGVLDLLSKNHEVDVPLAFTGTRTPSEAAFLHFDPSRYLCARELKRPKFLAIISSHVLATALLKRSNGAVDGFVVEAPSAGGHNAPPRGPIVLDEQGSPEYGPRDLVDFAAMRELGVPFWIAGGVTSPDKVRDALALGASGVQVGTLFAYCQESGMEPTLRREILALAQAGEVEVKTSMVASSTGYPFKVASIEGTISDAALYDQRERKCDLGYLREPFVRGNGAVGYRCAAEPVNAYIRKGGRAEDTVGTTCLCNALMATCGLGQVRPDGRRELPIVTSGDNLNEIRVVADGRSSYGAQDVITFLSAGICGDAFSSSR